MVLGSLSGARPFLMQDPGKRKVIDTILCTRGYCIHLWNVTLVGIGGYGHIWIYLLMLTFWLASSLMRMKRAGAGLLTMMTMVTWT